MNKLGILIGVGLAFNVCADPATPEQKEQLCIKFNEVATMIMTKRQQGVPLGALLKMVSENPGPAADPVKSLVIAAYKQPMFQTPEIQQRTILEFGDKVRVECEEAINK